MDSSWKNNPKLQEMDKEKLDLISNFASRAENCDRNQILSLFMNMNQEAGKRGIQFSDWETDLIVSVLTSDMNPGERKKIETLRLLAKKLAH